jgi:hypothetical protein
VWGNAMLDLIDNTNDCNRSVNVNIHKSTMLIRDIVENLSDTIIKAKIIGDKEIQYLTSIALESANEKLLLTIYEND